MRAIEGRDFDEERRAIHDTWEAAAPGWARQRGAWGEQSGAVAEWLIDHGALASGQRVLELAAGIGEVGFRALPRIAPGGTLICSDQSQAMVDAARAHAQELGLTAGIDFQVLNGEWIDLEVASVDRVLCRWGFMLMADPAAALRETRRVLRSGGRLALAVWDEPAANPWATIPFEVLIANGLMERPAPGMPGMFALSERAHLRGLLEEAGFVDVAIDAVEMVRSGADFASWWAMQVDLSNATRAALERAGAEQAAAVEAEIAARLAPHTGPDGAIAAPGRSLVAIADA